MTPDESDDAERAARVEWARTVKEPAAIKPPEEAEGCIWYVPLPDASTVRSRPEEVHDILSALGEECWLG